MSRGFIKPGRYSRPFKRGKYYYYCTYDKYGKRYKFSTGEKTRHAAEDECERRKELGILIYRYEPARKPETLNEYGKDFWDYDACPVIQDKIQRGGKFSRKLSFTYQGYFKNHISPVLGEKSLADITRQDVRSWLLGLPKKGLSNKSANNIFTTFRAILTQAVDDGLIERNVALEVKPLIKEKSRRGAFTPEQVKALFENDWDNRMAYIAAFLSSRTGMRVSEIRALMPEQVFSDHIKVDASWAEKEGRKCTKSGYSRIVPISGEVYDLLMEIMPPGPGLIFTPDGRKPMCINWFSRSLRKQMDKINGKLPDEENGTAGYFFDYLNKKEPLSFHSFRHFLNTRLLAAGLQGEKIRAVIGHEDGEMTEHYAHLDTEDLRQVLSVQNSIK